MSVMEDSIDIERIASRAVDRAEASGFKFAAAGGTREDAVQEVVLRLLKAMGRHDGELSSLTTYLNNDAHFGVLDYLRKLEADREKSRPARRLSRDIDGEVITDLNGYPVYEVDASERERQFRDESCQSEPLPGSGLERLEDTASLGVFLDSAMLACLTDDERTVIEYSFGPNGKEACGQRAIAGKIGKSQYSVSTYYNNALNKLRAEIRADEIMGL